MRPPKDFLEANKVNNVYPVKIYYVTTGRNAWRSTWIKRYYKGCMRYSLESAKSYCEEHRQRGTVFYIRELPSLAFFSEKDTLIVSEINTKDFFSRVNFNTLCNYLNEFDSNVLNFYQVYKLFRPISQIWPKDYPKDDSVIMAICTKPYDMSKLVDGDVLSSYASYSIGGNYLLAWSKNNTKDYNLDKIYSISSLLTKYIHSVK